MFCKGKVYAEPFVLLLNIQSLLWDKSQTHSSIKLVFLAFSSRLEVFDDALLPRTNAILTTMKELLCLIRNFTILSRMDLERTREKSLNQMWCDSDVEKASPLDWTSFSGNWSKWKLNCGGAPSSSWTIHSQLFVFWTMDSCCCCCCCVKGR